MNETQKDYLLNAMMFLEMVGCDNGLPFECSDDDLVWAAHSFVQAAAYYGKKDIFKDGNIRPSDDAYDLLSKVEAAAAIEDAAKRESAS